MGSTRQAGLNNILLTPKFKWFRNERNDKKDRRKTPLEFGRNFMDLCSMKGKKCLPIQLGRAHCYLFISLFRNVLASKMQNPGGAGTICSLNPINFSKIKWYDQQYLDK